MSNVSIVTVKRGLECCQLRAGKDGYSKHCGNCPYGLGLCDEDRLHQDTLELLDELQVRNKELKNTITTVFDTTLQSLHKVELVLIHELSAPEERNALYNSVAIIEEVIAKIKSMEGDTIDYSETDGV